MSKLKVGLCPSLTNSFIEKLQQHGVYSVTDFIAHDIEDLAKTLRISCKDVSAIRKVLLAQFATLPVTAADLFDHITQSASILSTSCNQLDQLLDGGFYAMEVAEIVGELGAGKTQLCLNVALTLIQSTNQNAIWIDTCGSFDITRLQIMMEERNITAQKQATICNSMQVRSAFDAMELLAALENIMQILAEQDAAMPESRLRLVIIDSVTALLSPLVSGFNADGYGMMMKIAHTLKQMAFDYSVAILLTNNLVGGDGALTPALGKAWASVPHSRLLIQRESVHRISPHGGSMEGRASATRTAKLIRSNRQPCGEAVKFIINEKGIEDFTL